MKRKIMSIVLAVFATGLLFSVKTQATESEIETCIYQTMEFSTAGISPSGAAIELIDAGYCGKNCHSGFCNIFR